MKSSLCKSSPLAPLFVLIVTFTACASTHPTSSVLPAAQSSDASDAFRQKIPAPGPQTHLEAPAPQRMQLSNGLTLLMVPKRDLPLVQMAAIIKTGSASDPRHLPGLASLTAELLERGTRQRDAAELDDEIETLGASLVNWVDEDTTRLSLAGLSSNREQLSELFADMVLHPSFKKGEVVRAKKRRKTELLEAESSPVAVARQLFRQTVFGAHPYGHISDGRPEGIDRIDQAALRSFYAEHYRPANAAIIVVGDFDVPQMTGHIDALFGGWRGRPGTQAPPVDAAPRPKELTLVDRAGAPQSQLLIGGVGLARNTPDYFAATLCNAIMGGMFHSRINMNLRESKGWTYGARSTLNFLRSKGPQAISAGVRTDVTGPAIQEALKEIATLRQADVTPEELQAAKNVFTLSLPGSFQDTGAIVARMSELFIYDLPLDYFRRLPQLIDAVTIADVRRVAENYFDPEHMSVVVVGDAKEIASELMALNRGPVVVRDVHGRATGKKVGQPKASKP